MKEINIQRTMNIPPGNLIPTTSRHTSPSFLRSFLSVSLFALILVILLVPVTAPFVMASGTNDEDDTSTEDLWDTIMEIILMVCFGMIGILCLLIYIPLAIRANHQRDMENALPEVLNEIAENIRSGRSVESAFKEVAEVRTDRIGRELRRASEEMLYTSFESAMRAFAQRSGSRAIIRIISLVLIAVESGASLANVLEKISGELWKVYILKKDREAKSATNASVILWGGVLFTPAIIAFILGVFSGGGGEIDIDMGPYDRWFIQFLMGLGLVSIIMRGVAMGTLKLDLVRAPFFTWLPWIVYVLVKSVSGSVIG